MDRPISYHQAPALALRLHAACLIVVAYLSGLRPAELLHLQPGSCPAPGDDGTGPVRYRLHGVKFKAARNDDGTPAPGGEARQWTVIPPVHTAIGILEQLTATEPPVPAPAALAERRTARSPAPTRGIPRRQQGQAAPHRPGDHHRGGQRAHRRVHHLGQRLRPRARAGQRDDPGRPGRPGHPQPLPKNHRLAHRPPARRHGSRWPSSTATCARSPARATAGAPGTAWPDLLDLETAAAMASYLQARQRQPELRRRRLRPRRPAARRRRPASRDPVRGACSCHPGRPAPCSPIPRCRSTTARGRSWPATTTRPRRCAIQTGKPGSTAGHPALDRCDPACANIARTDEHITALAAEIARLRAESASPILPGPIRQRLADRAAALEKIAERHARTRITTPGDDNGRR